MIDLEGLVCGDRGVDNFGVSWEYVGKTSFGMYVFSREYEEDINRYFPERGANVVRLFEMMGTHYNGSEALSEKRKIVRVSHG